MSDNNTKWTQGEWRAETDGMSGYFLVMSAPLTLYTVATVHGQDDNSLMRPDECQANANLIAAAPDMFNALLQVDKMAASLMDELGNRKAADWGVINTCLVDVATALAKARGEQP